MSAGAPVTWVVLVALASTPAFAADGAALARLTDAIARYRALAADGDRDGDGLGDACDPCTNMLGIFAVKPRVIMRRLDLPVGEQGFTFKGSLTDLPRDPPIDPAANGVRVMIEDKTRAEAVVDVLVPGGAGWKANRAGTSFRYANPTGFQGIRKIKVKTPAKKPGFLKFTVVGKKLPLVYDSGVPPLGTFVVDVPMATEGQCGETAFLTTGCKRNKRGNKLTCR